MAQMRNFNKRDSRLVPNDLWIVPISHQCKIIWGYLHSIDFQPSLWDMKCNLRLDIDTARRCIQILIKKKMIVADIKAGRKSTYITLDPSLWI